MPVMRKLSSEEVQAIERREQRPRVIPHQPQELPLLPYEPSGTDRSAQTSAVSLEALRIGDVIRLWPGEDDSLRTGIMLRLHADERGGWSGVELLIDNSRYVVPVNEIDQVVGRPRGISRIDQPSHRTHGWFVRLYDGHLPRVSRFFSDRTYGGIGAALKEALAFHAAEDQGAPDRRRRSSQLASIESN